MAVVQRNSRGSGRWAWAIVGVIVCGVLAFGQAGPNGRGGFQGGQPGGGGPSNLGAGLPPVQAIPPLGVSSAPYAPQGYRGGFSGGGVGRGYAYPGYWGGGYVGYPIATPPVTNVVVIEQPSIPVPPPVANPARPEVHEYKFESVPTDTSVSATDIQLFIVAMKDGSRQLASAVWAQGRDLQLIDENGAQKRVPLSTVDRQATQALNRARNLNLRIP